MGYQYEGKDPYFHANRSIVESEIRPGITVTFIQLVDLTQVEAMRKAAGKNRASYTSFVVKATAKALKEFPYANRRVCRNMLWPLRKCLQAYDAADIAVAAERDMPGVKYLAFADVIRDADQKSLGEVNAWLRALATCDESNNKQWRDFSSIIRKAPRFLASWLIRIPTLVPPLYSKYRGGSVLISSPAKYGVDSVVTSWTWPLGISFGFVKKRPIVRDDEIVAAPTFNFVLNFDRRVMAGAQAARFFHRLVEILEHAQEELGEVADDTAAHADDHADDLSQGSMRISGAA